MATRSEARVEEYFQCLICNQPVTRPKLLMCLHSFCEDCLQHECNEKGVTCPICEMVTKGGLTSLHDNTLVANLQSKVNKQQEILVSAELHCASCEESTSPEFMCLECDKLLCTKCLHTHQVLMTKHEKHVQTLGTLRKLDSDEFLKILRRPEPLFCSTHDDQQISLYCSTCSVWLCVVCLVLEHKDHSCNTIRRQIATQKNELRDMLGAVQKNEEKFVHTRGELELLVDKLNGDKYKMEELIKARVAAAIKKVKEEESRLLNELKELHATNTEKLQESLTRTENVLKRMAVSKGLVSQMLRYATEQEVLELQGMIKSALGRLQEEKPLDIRMENTVIDFQECWVYPKKMLGSLIVTKLRRQSVSDGRVHLPGCNAAALCCKEDGVHASQTSCDKRKCDAEQEAQDPKRQCVKEEPSNRAEGVFTSSPNYRTHSPTLCIESVTSGAEDDGMQAASVILDTVVELIQIDSEDSNCD